MEQNEGKLRVATLYPGAEKQAAVLEAWLNHPRVQYGIHKAREAAERAFVQSMTTGEPVVLRVDATAYKPYHVLPPSEHPPEFATPFPTPTLRHLESLNNFMAHLDEKHGKDIEAAGGRIEPPGGTPAKTITVYSSDGTTKTYQYGGASIMPPVTKEDAEQARVETEPPAKPETWRDRPPLL